MRKAVIATLVLFGACRPAFAADPAAEFVVKLFMDVCIPNIGQPKNVRTWAEGQHLAEIKTPAALAIFVGTGNKGTAWAIPDSSGSFALSIRGTTEACAVWARAADPEDVQTAFKQIVEGVKRPGIEVNVYQEIRQPGPVGEAHSLIYSITGPSRSTGFLFTMLTAEHPGGAFQASLQVAVSRKP